MSGAVRRLLLLAAASAPLAAQEAPASRPVDARAGFERGVAYLLEHQNSDGSWGGIRNRTMTDSFANAETHRSWGVATTGLVVHALLGAPGERAATAAARGVDALAAQAPSVKRCANWDIDNVWGYVYGLQGAAQALKRAPPDDAARKESWRSAAQLFIKGLAQYQSPNGGWGYYADPEAAWRPEWATSFTTAAAVLALKDAEAAGLAVPEKVMKAALSATTRARLPNGAYTYDVMALPRPRGVESIDHPRGSLGRTQVCGLARHLAGGGVPLEERREGIARFFDQHVFLDCALRKPIPHESWYANAAYFYLFGHYYAARMISTLPAEERGPLYAKVVAETLKTQEADGGCWDFYIASHTKAYGTAFALLVLQEAGSPAP
ncbi:MAG TPA: hypothetical protein VEI02_15615 [Planctomycetota bacterium]|nr:hypothetical protein [Planctomycetota bacterium]